MPGWLHNLIAEHTYTVVFVGVLLENAGLPIPGEAVLVIAAALATGQISLGWLILAGAGGAVVGDHLAYLMGRAGGRRLLRIYCRATLCSVDCESRLRRLYAKRGPFAVAAGRFLVGLRALLAPMAGVTKMPLATFSLADSVGAFSWAAVFSWLGWQVGERLLPALAALNSTILVVVGVFTVVVLAHKCLRLRRSGVALLLPTDTQEIGDTGP